MFSFLFLLPLIKAPPPKPEVTKLVMCAEKPRIRKSTDPWPLDNDYKEDQDVC
jgi:hypothetical protein